MRNAIIIVNGGTQRIILVVMKVGINRNWHRGREGGKRARDEEIDTQNDTNEFGY